MALESDFLDMASTTVTVTSLTGIGSYGGLEYSTSPATYDAAVEWGPHLVVTKQGRHEVGSAVIYVLSSSANIGVQDQVTLGASTAVRLLRVDVMNDDEGQHHVELTLG